MAKRSRGAAYGAQSGAFVAAGRTAPDAQFERHAQGLGFANTCGVDEAGRGPLAGPVVAAAVILPFAATPDGQLQVEESLRGLNDSKQITEKLREQLFAHLCQRAEVSVASVSPRMIDDRNIRKASLEAMRLAVLGLPTPADYALIDGKDEPPGLSCAAQALVKGDGRSLSIAAASICAKVVRDRMMVAAGLLYPQYDFATNKGYPTAAHRKALKDFGPCVLHRRTFGPVREALMNP